MVMDKSIPSTSLEFDERSDKVCDAVMSAVSTLGQATFEVNAFGLAKALTQLTKDAIMTAQKVKPCKENWQKVAHNFEPDVHMIMRVLSLVPKAAVITCLPVVYAGFLQTMAEEQFSKKAQV